MIQFNPILNGESGFSVRNKLNNAFKNIIEGEEGLKGVWNLIESADFAKQYLHIMFSAIEKPTLPSEISAVPNDYMGIMTSTDPKPSSEPADYIWFRVKGEQGVPGEGGTGGGLGGYTVLHNSDTGAATDANIMSALRVVSEINAAIKKIVTDTDDRYISKVKADEAAGTITFKDGLVAYKGDITSLEYVNTFAKAIVEAASKSEEVSSAITEIATDGDKLSPALFEASIRAASEGGAQTLGELDNVDSAVDEMNNTSNTLVLGKIPGSMQWQQVAQAAGGGGGGADVTMRLTAISELVKQLIYGTDVKVIFKFTSVYNSDQSETGVGTLTVKVNSATVITRAISQGDTTVDVTKYCTVGTNTIAITVVDSTGGTRYLTFSVQLIAMSISSTFNPTQALTDAFYVTFTPYGELLKTVHFLIDNKEIGTLETEASNRAMTFLIPAQTHGTHHLKIYMTATVDEAPVMSNVLQYNFMFAVSGNNTPLIAVQYFEITANQWQTITIPFSIHDPLASTTDIILTAGTSLVSERTVNRTLQAWNVRLDTEGNFILKIEAKGVGGNSTWTHTIKVEKSDIVVEAETTNLELFLPAVGRSNGETNRGEWKYKDISATLSGFNFVNNGWIADEEGSVALQISKGATVTIPYKPFSTDFRTTGKAIEFEFEASDITDYDTVIISCMDASGKGFKITAQEALMASEQVKVSAKFKEDERIRVSFVVESLAEGRLLFVYVDGIASGVIQYPTDDNFQQAVPLSITLGSAACVTRIYVVRAYGMSLNQFQILNNFIADIDNFDNKLEIYKRNQLYNTYGDIDYGKAIEFIPCMTIIGSLPEYKGDKKTVDITYEDRKTPANSFTSAGVTIDVQGTSSQFYPRKNYKTKHKEFSTDSGVTAKYALRPNSIAVNTFCQKADFAESSSTHNTGWARLVQEILVDMALKTPPMKTNESVRTTVDGFPILMFHKTSSSATASFLGKYNFNNDKSTQETFGFTGAAECWEVLNNTSDRVLFRSADFTGTGWLDDFEGRYPDGNENPVNLAALSAWIVSCKGNPTKFKSEAAQHFNKDFLLFYYISTELIGAVDQRAKNMMLASWGNEGSGAFKWYPIFYDNDTILGLNNEGLNVFGYNIESRDIIGQQYVFNGANSELWILVEEAFADEIATMYYNMRVNRNLTYERLLEMFNDGQSSKWAEVIYNMDMKFKYIDPFVFNHEDYLEVLQGSRSSHRSWWLYNRFRYIDSKYSAGDYLNDQIYMRLYTPASWEGIKPNSDFDITLAVGQYVKVKYGSYLTTPVRAVAGELVHVTAPAIQFNDTEAYIYGASRIRSLGDLSAQYAGSIDLSRATRLTEVIIGSGVTGYKNNNLTALSLGNNTLLKKVDIRNCPSFKSVLNLTGCEAIETILATGSGITAVNLPSAGILTEIKLPATITNLTLKNQSRLVTSGLTVEGYTNLSTLVIENTPGINGLSLTQSIMNIEGNKLTRVRITGIDAMFTGLDVLNRISKIGGIDEFGNNTEVAYLAGKYVATGSVTDYDLSRLQLLFPNLEITASLVVPAPIITINITSSIGESLTNVAVTSNVDYTRVNNTQIRIVAALGTKIEFNASADNHGENSLTHTVTATTTLTLILTGVPLRTLTVRDTGGSAVSGATVIWDESIQQTTNTSGQVSIRGSQARTFTAFKAGVGTYKGSIAFSISSTTTAVTLYQSILFTVVLQGVLIDSRLWGATVHLSTADEFIGDFTTDSQGTITAYVTAYSTIIVKATVGGELFDLGTVATASTAISRTFSINTENPDVFRPVMDDPNAIYLTIAANFTFYITVAPGTMTPFSIEYSNGVTQSGHVNAGTTPVEVLYSNTASIARNVVIRNCEGISGIRRGGSYISMYAFWSIGNSKLADLSFEFSNTSITFGYYMFFIGEADNIFRNDTRTSFYMLFASSVLRNVGENYLNKYPNKTAITSITYLLRGALTTIGFLNLDGFINVTTLDGLFFANTKITTLPKEYLKDLTKLISVTDIFSHSTIQSIPEDLFAYTDVITTITNLLEGCVNLTTIPVGLIRNKKTLTNISNLFNGSYVESIPDGFFAGLVNVNNVYRLFYATKFKTFSATLLNGLDGVTALSGCFMASSIEEIPVGFQFPPKTNEIISMFSSCRQLKSIPLDIFKSLESTEVGTVSFSMRGMFEGCSSLIAIPENILGFAPNKLLLVDEIFKGCTSLIALPANFGRNTKVESVTNIFKNCTGLEYSPEYIFQEFTKCYNFSYFFQGCTSLKTTPKYIGCSIEEGGVGATALIGAFSGCSSLTNAGISEDLLSNCSIGAYCYLDSFMSECKSITKVPNIFKKGKGTISNMSQTFYKTGITEIIAGIIESDYNLTWRIATSSSTSWQNCFSYCDELKFIGKGAFDRAFYRLSATSDVTASDTSNLNYLCGYCSKLKLVYFPKYLSMIPLYMFWGHTAEYNANLTAFVFERTTPPIIQGVGNNYFPTKATAPNLLIFVPDDSLAAYKAATNWAAYADIIYPISKYPGDTEVLKDDFNWYDWILVDPGA